MKGYVLAFAVLVAGVAAQTFPPSIVVHPPDETVATETKTVRFTCAAYGLPLPTITWINGNQQIDPNSNSGMQVYEQTMKFGATTFAISVLEISGVDSSAAGQYICRADNGITGAGLSESFAAFSLVVDSLDKEPAVLLEPPTSQTVDHGSSVEVVCVAYGNPVPTMSWSRIVPCTDGQPGECTREITDGVYNSIATYGDTSVSKSVLQMCNVSQVADGGNYRCTASNDIGGAQMSVDSSTWSLSVNDPPVQSTSTVTSVTATTTDCLPPERNPSTGTDVQPYQVVVAILAVIVVILIVVIVILGLLYVKKTKVKEAQLQAGIAGDESKVNNPIYAEPPFEADDKTLID